MGNGKIMTWRGSESTYGKMEGDMKGSIIMIKSAGTVSTTGPMAGSTKAGGTKASNMALEHIWILLKER